MNELGKRTDYGLDLHTQRIRNPVGESKERADEPLVKSDSVSKSYPREGCEYLSAPIWHNALYGIGTVGVILVPHYFLDKSYIDIMLGITAVALGVFFVISVLGIFQDFLPFGRQSQHERQRRR